MEGVGMIPLTHGFATLNGTKRNFAKKKVCDQKLRTTDGFYCLPIAVGTHLGEFSDDDSELYIEALTRAVDLGINFIDTAINYRGMRSEKDVGRALRLLIESDLVNRDQLIISTKAGLGLGTIDIHYIHNPEISMNVLGR